MNRTVLKLPLLKGEIFSSWLIRFALFYGCDPLHLTYYIWPQWRPWTIDIDRSIDKHKLKKLTKFISEECGYFSKSFLSKNIYNLSGNTGTKTTWPWVIAIGSRNRKRSLGLQFCPICFQNNSLPHFKVNWRYAWYNNCLDHNVVLIDKCLNCNHPILPHRLLATDKTINTCYHCKQDLNLLQPTISNNKDVQFQKKANEVFNNGFTQFDNKLIPSYQWFSILRFYILFSQQLAKNKHSNLTKTFDKLDSNIQNFHQSKTGLPLELTPTNERNIIISQAIQIFDTTPCEIRKLISDDSLKLFSLSELMENTPKQIEDIFNLSHSKTEKKKKEKVKKYTAKSKGSVLKMHARLLRKINNLNE